MDAFEKARPKNTAGQRELLPVDKKFAEAVDLYATLFPADPKLVEVIFKNGQMFYDYGDCDDAIKRFGLIVTKYPDDDERRRRRRPHPQVSRAGPGPREPRDLGAPAQEGQVVPGRRPAAPPRHASSSQSMGKSGDKYRDAGKYAQAAQFYLRVPKEFPKNADAAQSMMNAGVMYEKAKAAAARRRGLPGPGQAVPAARRRPRRPRSAPARSTRRAPTSTAPPTPTSWSTTSSASAAATPRRPPTPSTTPASCARPWARTSGPSRTTRPTRAPTAAARTPTTSPSASARSTRPRATTATPTRRSAPTPGPTTATT